MSRAAPDGGTANIGREEYDDGMFVCPDCGEELYDFCASVESYERFGKIICDGCTEARIEAEEDE